jgi:hypothetical protein
MSRKFGKTSLARLRTCHDDLQLLCHAVLEDMDITILCGHRNKADQDKAVAQGFSKAVFPKSKHNSLPSMAVDVAPYPVDWTDIKAFEKMCKLFEQKAEKMGIDIRLGRDFKGLVDLPHVELVGK